MTPDFHSVGIVAYVIGVMDCPGREPQHFPLKRG